VLNVGSKIGFYIFMSNWLSKVHIVCSK